MFNLIYQAYSNPKANKNQAIINILLKYLHKEKNCGKISLNFLKGF
ncbi:MAG: hypothetical protein J6B29_02285 [Clostridia bacterium]|nr:hypothetical protein [Clostridia bacterium]